MPHIYILRTQPSNSARELVTSLGGRRLREGARRAWLPRENDTVVCWGEAYNGPGRILNGAPVQNKLRDALKLASEGVATIQVSQTRPPQPTPPPPVVDPIIEKWETLNEFISDFPRNFPGRTPPLLQGVTQFQAALEAVRQCIQDGPPIQAPAHIQEEWLGRLRNHIGGRDLLNPPQVPDFWVKKEDIVAEYRVHSFLGSSIRAGKKKRVEGHPSDPATDWIRGLLNGWKISYDGVSVRQRHRDIAHEAIEALQLDFGAVDIGEKADGSLIVLEVNRAPGLDGGTITAYRDAILRWIRAGYPETLPERGEG